MPPGKMRGARRWSGARPRTKTCAWPAPALAGVPASCNRRLASGCCGRTRERGRSRWRKVAAKAVASHVSGLADRLGKTTFLCSRPVNRAARRSAEGDGSPQRNILFRIPDHDLASAAACGDAASVGRDRKRAELADLPLEAGDFLPRRSGPNTHSLVVVHGQQPLSVACEGKVFEMLLPHGTDREVGSRPYAPDAQVWTVHASEEITVRRECDGSRMGICELRAE